LLLLPSLTVDVRREEILGNFGDVITVNKKIIEMLWIRTEPDIIYLEVKHS